MAKKIRKAIIPAAGLGTRFLPATKAIPKEMLPIVDKPIIQYIVEELVASGIEQIVIVTGWHKRTIEDHFDYPFELEYRLMQAGKKELFDAQRAIADAAEFIFVRQREPLGTGHALLQAKSVIGDEPFLVHWGDDIIDAEVPAAKQLMDVYEKYEGSVLAVDRVTEDEISNYGAIEVDSVKSQGSRGAGDLDEERIYRVKSIVEKPLAKEAPSLLGQVCQFILTPDFFEHMARVKPEEGKEILHVDAIQEMAKGGSVYACEFEGLRFDCGRRNGYLQANLHYALKREDTRDAVTSFLKK